MSIVSYIFSVAVAACAVGFVLRGFSPAPCGRIENIKNGSGIFHRPSPLWKKDVLPLCAICAVYAIFAFIGLGRAENPETFYHFSEPGQSVTLEKADGRGANELMWYSGVRNVSYTVELSRDGESWTEQGTWEQDSGDQLKWHSEEPALKDFRYIKITAEKGRGYLGEVVLRNGGVVVPFLSANELTDEGDTAPKKISYMNSAYFDEVYHVRTAYEYLIDEQIYEISHPPLGKGIISLGIRVFGLNPFGWRFMGALCGVLMLPVLYVFLKNLFGRTAVAAAGTAVFAFDFMHFVQTRIATIDSYSTFFILLMFYFMYRWFVTPLDAPARRGLKWLFAAGLAFGVGAASKWTVIYGGAGLALIWLFRVVLLLRRRGKRALGGVFAIAAVSVLFFVLIPCVIYYFSYLPYGEVAGAKPLSREYLDIVIKNQKYMFNYHSTLEATHPYQSQWWKWVFDVRPILYYLEYFDDGTKSTFGAFGNPLFWWAGIGCMASVAVTAVRRRDAIGLFILIGYFSELVPWMGISRCAFIYHYFPSTVFLALALGYQMEGMCRAKERAAFERLVPRGELGEIDSPLHIEQPVLCDRVIFIFAGLCVLCFIVFYPVLTGVRISSVHARLLRWFGGQYPF